MLDASVWMLNFQALSQLDIEPLKIDNAFGFILSDISWLLTSSIDAQVHLSPEIIHAIAKEMAVFELLFLVRNH